MGNLEAVRPTLITLMLLFPGLGAVNAIYHGRLLQEYVRQTRRIKDLAGLTRFQMTVARQMYAALAQLILLTTPVVLYFFGVLTDHLHLGDIAFVVIPGTLIFALGYFFKKVEAQACRIPALGKDLEEQRLAVIKTWKTRPLPNW